MSLLSATQGAPERVWSLLRVINAHGGSLSRDELLGWLDPFAESKSAADQTLQAASSLDFVETQGSIVRLKSASLPKSLFDFSDSVHARLTEVRGQHADTVMFETMAWLIVSVEQRGGTQWLTECTAIQLADQIDAGLPVVSGDGERRFNDTKFVPWKRWIQFLGLGYASELTECFYPAIAARLEREVVCLPRGKRINADEFLTGLAQRMPYIDGGSRYEETAARLRLTRTSSGLSRTLSAALRELHDDGLITLETLGDDARAKALASGTHKVKHFLTVKIAEVTA